jgi:MoaA/NifB/PqqE/SkfB family radical SAM enzyme
MSFQDTLRMARFVSALPVKEHLAPNLHIRPLVAELFLTDNCNLRCVSCACWRSTTRGELETGEWEDVLRQLSELRILKVNFTGGEPLIRKDAVHLMEYAYNLGIRRLHLNTNGIRLSVPTVNSIIAAGVRSFNVSVDGVGEDHDKIRGRAEAFDRTIANVRYLIAKRQQVPLKIRLMFTLMRDTVNSLPAVAQLAQELDVQLAINLASDTTFLFRHEDVAEQTQILRAQLSRSVQKLEELARADSRCLPRYSDLRYAVGYFRDPNVRSLPCAESQLKLMIHSRGDIGGCWGHDPSATVRQTPIRDVIESSEYRAEHARFFRRDCVGCTSNYSVNLRWRPGTYVQGLLWRIGRRRIESV